MNTSNIIYLNDNKPNVVPLSDLVNEHPLDLLDPPNIVNTVVEARPMYYTSQEGMTLLDTTRRGLHVKGEDDLPMFVVCIHLIPNVYFFVTELSI